MNENTTKRGPDCGTCWQKDSCPRAKEGNFCTAWATKQPQERPRPDAWERGDTPWEER